MKKLKNIGLMLLCAVMSLSFAACSDDEEDVTTEYRVSVSTNPFLVNIDMAKVVEYDSNGIEVANYVIECHNGFGAEVYVANQKATMVKAFVNGKQIGITLFLNIGSSWAYNMLSITTDDL